MKMLSQLAARAARGDLDARWRLACAYILLPELSEQLSDWIPGGLRILVGADPDRPLAPQGEALRREQALGAALATLPRPLGAEDFLVLEDHLAAAMELRDALDSALANVEARVATLALREPTRVSPRRDQAMHEGPEIS